MAPMDPEVKRNRELWTREYSKEHDHLYRGLNRLARRFTTPFELIEPDRPGDHVRTATVREFLDGAVQVAEHINIPLIKTLRKLIDHGMESLIYRRKVIETYKNERDPDVRRKNRRHVHFANVLELVLDLLEQRLDALVAIARAQEEEFRYLQAKAYEDSFGDV